VLPDGELAQIKMEGRRLLTAAFSAKMSMLVLRRPIIVTHRTKGKFEPKWEVSFVIEQVYDGGAYQLIDY
jgi:hypothetical protein